MEKVIAFYIATLTRGGAERVMAGLANYFAGQDYRVYLLTLEEDEGLYPVSDRVIKQVLTMPAEGGRLANALGRIIQVRRVLKEAQAQALVSFIGKTNIRAVLASLGLRTKVFVSVRSAPEREYRPGIQRMLAKGLFCLADGLIFQTEEARDFFSKTVRRKSRILPNPLSEEFVREPYPGERENVVVTVGRSDPVKNHALLVDAFAIVEKKHPEMTLRIYGDGECIPALKRQAQALDVEDKVFFMGDRDRIAQEIEKARIFVLSSDFEGMPNAVAEAMALGLSVVSTDCPSGGARALIKDGETGLLVPVRDPRKMADAILRILADEKLEKKLSAQGHDFAIKLSAGAVHRMWQDYIEEVCGR